MNMFQAIEEDCKLSKMCECCDEVMSTWLVVYNKGICKVFTHLCEGCRVMNNEMGYEGDEYIKSC